MIYCLQLYNLSILPNVFTREDTTISYYSCVNPYLYERSYLRKGKKISFNGKLFDHAFDKKKKFEMW